MKKNEWYFYRIENDEGAGPYRSAPRKCRPQWMLGEHGGPSDKVHPPLGGELSSTEIAHSLDRSGVRFKECKFGFVSLRQLQRWFTPVELVKLYKLGYRIRRVLGRSVVDSPTQSLFVPVEGVCR